MAAAAAARAYDLVVWGGSGFTGRLAAEYLARRYTPGNVDPNSKGSSEPVRWAIAGRDRVKLESVRESIEAKHPHAKGKIDILIGTNDDPASLESVACVANTVLSFAGPFAICGAPIVDACVKCGTDYCDITGEPTFIRDNIDRHDASAKSAGVKLVSCVGYDSVPWDIGAFAVAKHFRDKGDECVGAVGHAGAARGGVSGGTIASAINLMETTPWDVLRRMGSPFFLSPAGDAATDAARSRWRTQSSWRFDEDVGRWTMPSVMAGINTKVVARSWAIDASGVYGKSFAYDESDICSGRFAAAFGTAALTAFGAALMFPPTRWLLKNHVLPKPGQGPSEALREGGFANIYVVGTGEFILYLRTFVWAMIRLTSFLFITGAKNGDKAVAHVEFKGADPGYKGTAALAVEAALCMALPSERAKLPEGGGCLTPATALGTTLVDRMNASENFAVDVKPLADAVIRG